MKILPNCDDVIPCIARTNMTFWRITNLCPLRGMGGPGFDPGPDIQKSLKMELAAPRLALRFTG